MAFTLKFFGTSSATPSLKRGFACIGLVRDRTSQEHRDVSLLDCGDGAIKKLLSFNADVLDIPRIFITHYHSDHVSGIVQIIETMGIRKRETHLDIYGPRGLKEYFSTIQKITHVATTRRFDIKLHELEPKAHEKIAELDITTFKMDHTVPCIGYRIEVDNYAVAYTGDTQPCAQSVDLSKGCDVLVHEATYLQKNVQQARITRHSTVEEAGKTAKDSGTRTLVLTHVNEEYESDEEMKTEVAQEFRDSRVASDGLEIKIE